MLFKRKIFYISGADGKLPDIPDNITPDNFRWYGNYTVAQSEFQGRSVGSAVVSDPLREYRRADCTLLCELNRLGCKNVRFCDLAGTHSTCHQYDAQLRGITATTSSDSCTTYYSVGNICCYIVAIKNHLGKIIKFRLYNTINSHSFIV